MTIRTTKMGMRRGGTNQALIALSLLQAVGFDDDSAPSRALCGQPERIRKLGERWCLVSTGWRSVRTPTEPGVGECRANFLSRAETRHKRSPSFLMRSGRPHRVRRACSERAPGPARQLRATL